MTHTYSTVGIVLTLGIFGMSCVSPLPTYARPTQRTGAETRQAARALRPPATEASAATALPLAFEPNLGQSDPSVRFVARESGYTAFLTDDALVLAVSRHNDPTSGPHAGAADAKRNLEAGASADPVATGEALAMRVEGASTGPRFIPEDSIEGVSNYLIGSDTSRWVTNVPHYGAVRWPGVYDGIDLLFHEDGGQLEYDLDVKPGADTSQIRVHFEGQKSIEVDDDGTLVLVLESGEVRAAPAHVYQHGAGGIRDVAARYDVDATGGVAFAVDSYDHDAPLVIDPTFSFIDRLGGSDVDGGYGIAIDATGAIYITGLTYSTDFPTSPGAFDTTRGFKCDAFVTKLNSTGGILSIVYSTFHGGNNVDRGQSIAVDGSGSAYVAGTTWSTNFPTTQGAYDRTLGPLFDAFIAKLSADGSSLVYSTYLGGNAGHELSALENPGSAIAVDGSGSAYVAGTTYSRDFPTTPGAYDHDSGGDGTVFVTKLPPDGSGLVYSTYLGGTGFEQEGVALALDSSGSAYVTGATEAANFPTTPGAYDRTFGAGYYAAFVTKLSPGGGSLVYSTFLGTESVATAIAIAASGAAYVAGKSDDFSSNSSFPTTAGAFDVTRDGGRDAFVTKVNPSGMSLLYSTFLGGDLDDEVTAIRVNALGQAFVTGRTTSQNFPQTGLHLTVAPPATNLFVSKLGANGTSLVSSTVRGGNDIDSGQDLALDGAGAVYVTGRSPSTDFPTIGFGPGGSEAAFVLKVDLVEPIPL